MGTYSGILACPRRRVVVECYVIIAQQQQASVIAAWRSGRPFAGGSWDLIHTMNRSSYIARSSPASPPRPIIMHSALTCVLHVLQTCLGHASTELRSLTVDQLRPVALVSLYIRVSLGIRPSGLRKNGSQPPHRGNTVSVPPCAWISNPLLIMCDSRAEDWQKSNSVR